MLNYRFYNPDKEVSLEVQNYRDLVFVNFKI